MILYKVCDLQKRYDHKPYIFPCKINFQIEKNQIWIVLGGSGVGKSTLFKCLLGTEVHEGVIIKQCSLSALFTENHLDEDLSLRRNFQDYYEVFDISYDRVGLQEYIKANQVVSLDELVKNCSFGTQRRFSLYRILFEKTDLIFLDEPTTGFDLVNIKKIKNLIEKQSSLKSFFVVTHDRQLSKAGTHFILMSDIFTLLNSKNLGGYIKTFKSILEENLWTSEGVCVYSSRKEDLEIRYFTSPEKYNRMLKLLYEHKIPHKCSWIDGSEGFSSFLQVYF